MRQYILPLVIFATIVFSSCSKSDDFRLSSSIFIPDKDFPGLPIYSELGYNSFGAYFDRTPFVSDSYIMPLKVIVKSDTCQFAFTGRGESVGTLTFHFPGYKPETFHDLLSLNDKTFSLTDKNVRVTFPNNRKENTLHVYEGVFSIKKAQKLFVDKELKKVVISGTFSLKVDMHNTPVSINNGRFDISVDENNFFPDRKN